MKPTILHRFAALAALFTIACEAGTDPDLLESLAAAFESAPPGFSNTASSFAGSSDSTAQPWRPGSHHRSGGMGVGRGGRGPGGFMMGGGLGGLFFGDGFGHGFGRGRFGGMLTGDCDYDADSGRVVCAPETRHGLTIYRSAAYYDANGQLQTAFDNSTTNTVNLRVSVSGTLTRRDGNTSVVEHASDRTLSGLAPGSTERTVEGTSAGQETTTGTNARGAFTAERVIGDTVQGVVIPIQTEVKTYPTAGMVIRSMQVTVTYEGQEPITSLRREVITYDGSDTATVVITHDGETRTCTLPLPRGRLSCS